MKKRLFFLLLAFGDVLSVHSDASSGLATEALMVYYDFHQSLRAASVLMANIFFVCQTCQFVLAYFAFWSKRMVDFCHDSDETHDGVESWGIDW